MIEVCSETTSRRSPDGSKSHPQTPMRLNGMDRNDNGVGGLAGFVVTIFYCPILNFNMFHCQYNLDGCIDRLLVIGPDGPCKTRMLY
jgi:hypothetical protein